MYGSHNRHFNWVYYKNLNNNIASESDPGNINDDPDENINCPDDDTSSSDDVTSDSIDNTKYPNHIINCPDDVTYSLLKQLLLSRLLGRPQDDPSKAVMGSSVIVNNSLC